KGLLLDALGTAGLETPAQGMNSMPLATPVHMNSIVARLAQNPMPNLWRGRSAPLDFLRADRLLCLKGGGHAQSADGPRRCALAVCVHHIRMAVRAGVGRATVDRATYDRPWSFAHTAKHR